MNLKVIAGIFIILISACHHAGAAQSNAEKAAKAFIQRMYSFSFSEFELANIDNHLNLNAHCDLLRQYFSEELVKQPTINSGCLISPLPSIRFPSLTVENLMATPSHFGPQNIEVSDPLVYGDEASINVTTGNARTTYFLKKVDNAWRIGNALIFIKWPTNEASCRGTFLTPPSKDQRNFKAEACRSLSSKL